MNEMCHLLTGLVLLCMLLISTRCIQGQAVSSGQIDLSSIPGWPGPPCNCLTWACPRGSGKHCKPGPTCSHSDCQPIVAPDGQYCTLLSKCDVGPGQCKAGLCIGKYVKPCQESKKECKILSCSPLTGECEIEHPAPDGYSCHGGKCKGGVCKPVGPVKCPVNRNPCKSNAYDKKLKKCVPRNKADGSTCIDNNPCTTGDACTNGRCSGTVKACNDFLGLFGVDNRPTDTQMRYCTIGFCNPKTGACKTRQVSDGSTCDDGKMCTTNDTCRSGQCVGTNVTCTATQVCSEATGTCGPKGTPTCPPSPPGDTPSNSLGFQKCSTAVGDVCKAACGSGAAGLGYNVTCVVNNGVANWSNVSGSCTPSAQLIVQLEGALINDSTVTQVAYAAWQALGYTEAQYPSSNVIATVLSVTPGDKRRHASHRRLLGQLEPQAQPKAPERPEQRLGSGTKRVGPGNQPHVIDRPANEHPTGPVLIQGRRSVNKAHNGMARTLTSTHKLGPSTDAKPTPTQSLYNSLSASTSPIQSLVGVKDTTVRATSTLPSSVVRILFLADGPYTKDVLEANISPTGPYLPNFRNLQAPYLYPNGGSIRTCSTAQVPCDGLEYPLIPQFSNCPVSVCFAVDGSASIDSTAWQLELSVMDSIAGGAKGCPKATIAVVQFSDTTEVIIPPSNILNADTHAARKSTQLGGFTNMAAGIDDCQKYLTQSPMNMAGNNPVIVLLTDGQPNEGRDVAVAASEAKRAGTTILTLGVAGADLALMSQLSSGPGYDFSAAAFSSDSTNIAVNMAQKLCSVTELYHVVVYGAGLGGIAAAMTAIEGLKATQPNPRVLLISTDSKLGGLATVGGQNFFDFKTENRPGSLGLFTQLAKTQCYNTVEFANALQSHLISKYQTHLDVLGLDTNKLAYDIQSGGVTLAPNDKTKWVQELRVHPLQLVPGTLPVFDPSGLSKTVRGSIFIDASETGRLAQMAKAVGADIPTVIGRTNRVPTDDQERCVNAARFLDGQLPLYSQPCKTSALVGGIPDGSRIQRVMTAGKVASQCSPSTPPTAAEAAAGALWTEDTQAYIKVKYNGKEGWVPFVDISQPTWWSDGITPAAQPTGYVDCCADNHATGACSSIDSLQDTRQMAATLMFKVTKVPWYKTGDNPQRGNRCYLNNDKNPNKVAFNYKPGPEYNQGGRFAIKGINAGMDKLAQDPVSSLDNEWWVNGLLIFGVDGLCEKEKDGAQALCPSAGSVYNVPETTESLEVWDAGKAYTEAYKVVENAATNTNSNFLKGLRELFNAPDLAIVTDGGKPVVGERLYLRETIHTTDNTGSYGLTGRAAYDSATPTPADSVAQCFYQMDSNGYRMAKWGRQAVTDGGVPKWEDLWTRGDTRLTPEGLPLPQNDGIPWDFPNPFYNPNNRLNSTEPPGAVGVPYRTLVVPGVDNLLVPGYAASMDSWAWTECRVLPPLTSLGEAAGAAAAVAIADGGSMITQNVAKIRANVDLVGGVY